MNMKYSRIDTETTRTINSDLKANKTEATYQSPVLGFIYVALSGVCFTGMVTTIKWFDSIKPFSWVFYRTFVNFLLNAVALLWKGIPIADWFGTEKKQVMFLSLRAFFGVSGMTCGFIAYQLLELGDASCFRQSVPVWSCIFGYIFLSEKLDWVEICLVTLIMCGLIVVSRPSFLFGLSTYSPGFIYGSTAGILSAICSSIAYICIKKVKIVKPETPNFVIVNYLMCGGMFMSYPLCLLTKTSFQIIWGWQILGACFAGSCGFMGQYLMTAGIGMERVGPVISVRSGDIILMFLFQGLIWGFDTSGLVYSISGALAIVFGTVSLGVHKWRKTRYESKLKEMDIEEEMMPVKLDSCIIQNSGDDKS